MTTRVAGLPGTAAHGSYIPAHFLRRMARLIIIRSALRGRLSWPVALAMLAKIGGAA